MFAANGLALLDDEFPGQDDIFRSGRAFQVHQPLLDVLGLFHQFVAASAQAVVEGAVQLIALRLQLGQPRCGLAGGLLQLVAQLAVELALSFHKLFVQPLQGALARLLIDLGNDVLREVEHTVEVATGNIEQQTHIAGHAARIPYMRHRRSQLNVAKPLAPNRRAGDLHAAFVTDDALVTDVLVLAAIALPVARRAEDGQAEQAVLLRAQPAIIDRLRLGHLTI